MSTAAALPDNEVERLASLERTGLLDSPQETRFDEIVEMAARVCNAPISLISLVDKNRQWFKAKTGIEERETVRSVSFCAHAILQSRPLIVDDTLNDVRFRENVLVTGEPHIRYYAGIPIATDDGHPLGTLCVIDRKPRELDRCQLDVLDRLARCVRDQIETSGNPASDGLNAPMTTGDDRIPGYRAQMFSFVCLLDYDGRVADINDSPLAAIGIPRSDITGQFVWETPWFIQNKQSAETLRIEIERARNGFGIRNTFQYTDIQGTARPVEYSLSLVGGGDLEERRLFLLEGRDITEKLELEEQLRRSIQMDTVEQVVSGIAHDFNNALTIIMGNAELLVRESPVDSPSYELAKRLSTAARSSAQLTRKLLSLNQVSSSKQSVTTLRNEIADKCLDLKKTLGKSIEIQTAFPEEAWTVNLDIALFEAALVNLSLNARDAMSNGGHLSIEISNETVDHSKVHTPLTGADGDYVVLRVTDTGEGMTEEIRRQAFKPFFTTRKSGGGTGLGLSMIERFVIESGGFITLSSAPGEGTIVSLFFPRDERQETIRVEAPIPQSGETSLLAGRRILVVDDNPMVLQTTSDLIRLSGGATLTVSTAEEALAAVKKDPTLECGVFDVDLGKGMNGFELAHAVSAINPALKVIFVSGHFNETMAMAREHLESSILLDKPLTAKMLRDAIQDAVGR